MIPFMLQIPFMLNSYGIQRCVYHGNVISTSLYTMTVWHTHSCIPWQCDIHISVYHGNVTYTSLYTMAMWHISVYHGWVAYTSLYTMAMWHIYLCIPWQCDMHISIYHGNVTYTSLYTMAKWHVHLYIPWQCDKWDVYVTQPCYTEMCMSHCHGIQRCICHIAMVYRDVYVT